MTLIAVFQRSRVVGFLEVRDKRLHIRKSIAIGDICHAQIGVLNVLQAVPDPAVDQIIVKGNACQLFKLF